METEKLEIYSYEETNEYFQNELKIHEKSYNLLEIIHIEEYNPIIEKPIRKIGIIQSSIGFYKEAEKIYHEFYEIKPTEIPKYRTPFTKYIDSYAQNIITIHYSLFELKKFNYYLNMPDPVKDIFEFFESDYQGKPTKEEIDAYFESMRKTNPIIIK